MTQVTRGDLGHHAFPILAHLSRSSEGRFQYRQAPSSVVVPSVVRLQFQTASPLIPLGRL